MELSYNNFEEHLLENFSVSKLKKIAVAVSGGVDSMCLTFLLNEVCKRNNISLTAITVDHKLREKSTFEANKVSQYLRSISIDHIILTWQHGIIKSDIQNKARQARYKLICDYCKDHNIENLFVAHTFDDQAETVLLRILRGSGVDGISGIEFKIEINKVHIIRPLLKFKKSQILNFMQDQNLLWFEDESNKNIKFDRVKVRNLISDCDEDFKFTQRLNLLAENAKRAKNFIDYHVKKVFEENCVIGNLGYISIQRFNLLDQHEEIRFRLINHIIRYIKNNFDQYPIRIEKLKSLSQSFEKSNQLKSTIHGCVILLHRDIIYFYKEQKFIEPMKILNKGKSIWDNRYTLFINLEGLQVSNLTKEVWSKIKQKKHVHDVPGDIIFSTPVIFSKAKDLYILPLSNIIYSSSRQSFTNLKVSITHILSETCFEINH